MKKYITWIAGFIFFSLAGVAVAAPAYIFQRTIIPEIDSTYELGTTTKAWLKGYFDEICLTASTCRTTWPTGGAGSQTPWEANIDGATYSLQNVGSITATSSLITQATSTNLAITGITSSLLKTNANGSVIPAVAGTDYVASTFSYPFPNNATTSTLTLGGLSVTGIANFNGLTNNGGATTTSLTVTDLGGYGLVLSNAVPAGHLTLTATSTLYSNLSAGGMYIGANGQVLSGATTTFSTGLTYSNGNVVCDSGSSSVFGCLTSANFSVFNNKISSSSLSGTNGVTYNSSTGVIDCTASSRSATGCLSSAYFTVFDNKVSSSSLFAYPFPNNATTSSLTLGGLTLTSFSGGLGANPNTGLVYGAPTTTFTGTSPISLTYLNGQVTGACTTASAGVAGCLNSTDWSTFNGKENVLTFNSPLVRSSNTISIFQWPFSSATTYTGVSTSTLINFSGGIMSTASSTLQLLKATDLTVTNTITGSVSGSAGSVTNALTFSNSGTGDASGTTYNGSAARTISYNSIGAQPSGSYATFAYPFTSATTYTGVSTSTLLNLSGGVMSTASSTFQSLRAGTFTMPSLSDGCVTVTTGVFGSQTCGAGSTFPFTSATTYTGVSTSTLLNLAGGVMSTASSTLQLFKAGTINVSSNGTNAWLISNSGSANQLDFSTSTVANATTSFATLSLLSTGGIQINNGQGTSTLVSGYGLDLTNGGCFAIRGTCMTGGAASAIGGTGAVQFANGAAFAGDVSNFFWDDTNNLLGLATGTPGTLLSLGATGAGININANATSTFNKGINLNGGCFAVNGTCVGGSSGSSQWTTLSPAIYYADNVVIGSATTSDTNAKFTISTSTSFTHGLNDVIARIVGASGAPARVELVSSSDSVNGSFINFVRTGGTLSVPTAVTSDMVLGAVGVSGFGSTVVKNNLGFWAIKSESTFTDTSAPTYQQWYTTPSASVTALERMRLTSNGRLGIGSSSPIATLSVVQDVGSEGKLFQVGTSTLGTANSIAMYIEQKAEKFRFLSPNNWFHINIGGSTTTNDRYEMDAVQMDGRMNSDTMLVQCDPMRSSLATAAILDSNSAAAAPASICDGAATYDFVTDASLHVVSPGLATTTGWSGDAAGNGCNDGGPWYALVINNAAGAAAATEAGWLRGSAAYTNIGAAAPAIVAGGTLMASSSPVMEVTICTPTLTTNPSVGATSTGFAFGFIDTPWGTAANAPFITATGINGVQNGAWLAASSSASAGSKGWVGVNANAGVVALSAWNGTISTTTTRNSPQTFRIMMTSTSTYYYILDYSQTPPTWKMFGTNAGAKQTSRPFTWFIGGMQYNSTNMKPTLYFRNLKVWASPTYRN